MNSKKKPVDSSIYTYELYQGHLSIGNLKEFLNGDVKELRPRIYHSFKLGEVKPGMKILDIGCGKGEIIISAALRGAYAIGIDYSENAIKVAKEVLKDIPEDVRKKIEILRQDAKEISFQERVFDRIFLLDIVEHLHNWELERMFKEIDRLLKADGYLVIHTVPNSWAYDWGYKIIRLFFRKLPKNPRTEMDRLTHINEQNIVKLNRLLKRRGFKSKIWLENMINQEANWKYSDRFNDLRSSSYKIFRRPTVKILYNIINKTFFKLVFCSDIFCIAWRKYTNPKLPNKNFPSNYTEKVVLSVSKLFFKL